MIKKLKTLVLAMLFIAGASTIPSNANAQEIPPTGTCCKTNSGAICVVGIHFFVGYYYLASGDCPSPPPGEGGGNPGFE